MSNWSLDFETLSTVPNAKVLSLGMVKFDIRTGNIQEEHFWKFNVDEQTNRVTDAGTEAWWAKQSDAAKAGAFGGDVSLETLTKDINALVKYDSKAQIWGNGATFDVSILEHIFGYNTPFKFWNIRDMRTMVMAAEVIGFSKDSVPREGTHHDALDDARHQAKVISKAYRTFKGMHNAYYSLKSEHQKLVDKVNP